MSTLLSKLIVVSASFTVLTSIAQQQLPLVTFTESGGTLTESSTLFSDIVWTPVPGQAHETWRGPGVGAVGFRNGYIEWLEPDGSGLVNRVQAGPFGDFYAVSDVTATNISASEPAGAVVPGWVNIQDQSTGSIVPVQANFQYVDLDETTSNVNVVSAQTWTPSIDAPNKEWWSVASSADGAKLVAVVYGGGVYTSSDSGLDLE